MSTLPTVCFLTGTLNAFAGAERMTTVIANALADRGYRVLVLSLWDKDSCFPLHDGVSHHTLFTTRPSFKRAYLSTVMAIRGFVRRNNVDVLIGVDTMLTLFTLPATLGQGVRHISWEHCHFDEDLGRPIRKVARWLAGKFNRAVIVLTERDAKRWRSALTPNAHIVTIANPLPFAFPSAPSPRLDRVVLAVGRLTHAKGFDILIEAWAKVTKTHSAWRLVILGEGEDRESLEKMVRDLGLASSVALPGATTEICGGYQSASIFCLSSRYEGFGLVLLEAMAFGLPIAAFACETGPKELIVDGKNGLLVAPQSPSELAKTLGRLMEDTRLCDALSLAARDDARVFSIDLVINQWQTLLKSL